MHADKYGSGGIPDEAACGCAVYPAAALHAAEVGREPLATLRLPAPVPGAALDDKLPSAGAVRARLQGVRAVAANSKMRRAPTTAAASWAATPQAPWWRRPPSRPWRGLSESVLTVRVS